MSVKVSIQPIDTYEPAKIKYALKMLLAPLGTMGKWVENEPTVVLKPNLLAPRSVSRAVSTHPEVIRQTAALAQQCGVKEVLVTDSPGIGTAQQVAKKMGLDSSSIFRVLDVDETQWVSSKDAGMWRLHLAKLLIDHPIINIAKAKTHGQMIITAAVKNMFGAVVGLEKAQWHYRIGRDPFKFARLVVHIHQMIQPRLNILDGIIGMEGNGPGAGTPRQLGFLMASENAHAMDYLLCKIWGLNPMKVYTIRAAKDMGLLPEEKDIEVIGASISSLCPSPPWKMAAQASVAKLAGPHWMIPVFERLLSASPKINDRKCTMCLECVHHCAAKAMDVCNGRIKILEKECISCFCCQEMCPHGAITVQSGALARVLRLGR